MISEGLVESRVGHRQGSMKHDASRVRSGILISENSTPFCIINTEGGIGHRLGHREARLTLYEPTPSFIENYRSGE